MSGKNSKTILIVGDSPQVLDILAEQKTLKGNRTILVSNGEEAIRIAAKQPAIDFLYADLMLGNGYSMPEVTGVDFARQFIKLYPKASVLYMIL